MKKAIALALAILMVAAMNLVAGEGYTYSDGIFTIQNDGDFSIQYYSPGSKYGQVTNFGYYFQNDPETKITLDKHLTGNETVVIKNLSAGDKIGLYFETKKNTTGTVYSEGGLNYKEKQLFFIAGEDDAIRAKGPSDNYFTFGDAKWGDGQVLAFEVVGTTTTGQPLPGLLTTIVLGTTALAGGAVARRRRNRK